MGFHEKEQKSITTSKEIRQRSIWLCCMADTSSLKYTFMHIAVPANRR